MLLKIPILSRETCDQTRKNKREEIKISPNLKKIINNYMPMWGIMAYGNIKNM